jgi:predicted O-linked N-acetylglucosamine transferase (SPINDLY family)
MDTAHTALALFRHGRVRDAELACERRLAVAGDDVDSLTLLAEIHLVTGRTGAALPLLERLTHLRPDDASLHRRFGGLLLTHDRIAAAVDTLRIAVELEPLNARGHNNLGQALLRLGDVGAAIASHREATRLDPGYAIAFNNLGLALTVSGEWDAAADAFQQTLALDATLAVAKVNLAAVFEHRCAWTDALRCYEQALSQAPDLVAAWTGRAAMLARLQRFDEALECCEAALKLRPAEAAALIQKAWVLLALERATEALSCADAALAIEPATARAHNVRAGALRRLGRRAAALECLETAIALEPDYAEAATNLSLVLHEMGRTAESIAAQRRALTLAPDDLQSRTRYLARLIPSVPLTAHEARDARAAFDGHMVDLENWLDGRPLSREDAWTVAAQQLFYLSYDEVSNRTLLERYRTAAAARLATVDSRFSEPQPARTVPSGSSAPRFRLGFVSAHVHDHSVFNAILRGWLEHLDRERFEVILFSLGSTHDAMTRDAAASVDEFVADPRPIDEWAQSIRGHRLDALIYPEVGMNETTLALAASRLARRQFVAWGHPETSGLPTMDGFLSAAVFEPPGADAHYAERLIRLPHLGVHCRPYGVEVEPLDLERFWGVRDDGPLFVCAGVPFKYRPEDDAVWVEIARSLGRCTFVFFRHEMAELSDLLQARIATAFRSAGLDPARYLKWLPWQPRPRFFALLRQADVYLDTLGFSGFNTLIQAIECHLPCVTLEGQFLRGRLGSGILRHLGLDEWVAETREEYVDRAVRLGASAANRQAARAAIRQVESRAYGDVDAVRALTGVLLESDLDQFVFKP